MTAELGQDRRGSLMQGAGFGSYNTGMAVARAGRVHS